MLGALATVTRRAGIVTLSSIVRVVAGRMVTEAVHEVGHLFGLLHCDHPRCVMRRSTAVRDVDAKGSRLCADCRTRLAERSGGSGLEAT